MKNEPLFYLGLSLLIAGFLAWAWIHGIDDMIEKHPDYTGEDMLDETPNKKDNNSNKQ
jgi:hypothetical protein